MASNRCIHIFLIIVSLMLVMMPAIPHHHHGNGVVCMKDDIKESDCCSSNHQHHHPEDDPCCTGDCITHINTSVPTIGSDDIQPGFVYTVTLFTHSLLRFLTQPDEPDPERDYVYRESLYGTYITRAAGLRAPPSLI